MEFLYFEKWNLRFGQLDTSGQVQVAHNFWSSNSSSKDLTEKNSHMCIQRLLPLKSKNDPPKWLNYSSAWEWMTKLWFIHSMKHCTIVKSMFCNYKYQHGLVLKTFGDQKSKCKLLRNMYNRAALTWKFQAYTLIRNLWGT